MTDPKFNKGMELVTDLYHKMSESREGNEKIELELNPFEMIIFLEMVLGIKPAVFAAIEGVMKQDTPFHTSDGVVIPPHVMGKIVAVAGVELMGKLKAKIDSAEAVVI